MVGVFVFFYIGWYSLVSKFVNLELFYLLFFEEFSEIIVIFVFCGVFCMSSLFFVLIFSLSQPFLHCALLSQVVAFGCDLSLSHYCDFFFPTS